MSNISLGEIPLDFWSRSGDNSATRYLQLTGLNLTEGKKVLQDRGNLQGSDRDREQLINYYAGNPLALKIVSASIRELFNSNLREFWQTDIGLLGNIKDLLQQQSDRFSDLEKDIMYWLALSRESIQICELQEKILGNISPNQLLTEIESLKQRSLVEKTQQGFTLQPVIMEFFIQKFIDKIEKEITTKQPKLLNVSSGEDLTIKVWDINLNLCIKTFTGHKSIIWAIAISRSGKLVASGGWDHQLKIWSLTPSRCLKTIAGYANFFWSVAFHPIHPSPLTEKQKDERRIIASGSHDGKVRLWDIATTECLQIFSGHTNWVESVVFSPDGKILDSCGGDRYIKLWDVATGKSLFTLQQHQGIVRSVHFSPDGKLLASASNDCSVKIWDIDTGICLKTLANFGSCLELVKFSADGKWLVTSTSGGKIQLWDISIWECWQTLNEDRRILSAAFSLDSCLIACGMYDGTIKLWDISTWECWQTLAADQDLVYCLDFLPDDQTLVSVSHDRTIKFWDIKTGECLATLEGHSDRILDLDISQDGQYLATASYDETIKIWHKLLSI